jgi:hypothetical protein
MTGKVISNDGDIVVFDWSDSSRVVLRRASSHTQEQVLEFWPLGQDFYSEMNYGHGHYPGERA